MSKTYDLVVYGATGFTGRLVAQYLDAHGPQDLRFALAGRNLEKLEKIKAKLVRKPDLIQANANDPESLAAMAKSTQVVLSTVGPFIKYGEPLVAACAQNGAHYADITGEPEFVSNIYAAHDATARQNKLKLVSCCGFDSIPHDLGAWLTAGSLPRDTPIKVEGFVRAKGQMSGGTWNSALEAMGKRALDARFGPATPEGRKVGSTKPKLHRHKELGAYAFPLPTIDPAIVLASARTSDHYGPEFRYGHYGITKSLPLLIGGGVFIGGSFALAQVPPLRKLMGKVWASGDGPDEAQREAGWFDVRFFGEGGGQRVQWRVGGDKDPGYAETAKMIAESALSLAFDELPERYGVITPAMAFEQNIVDRLVKAGLRFEQITDS